MWRETNTAPSAPHHAANWPVDSVVGRVLPLASEVSRDRGLKTLSEM